MKQVAARGSRLALWLLRLALSGVFIYAGVVKIRDPQSFSESIASFRLLPTPLINLAALTLPPLEIFAGILALCGGHLRRFGSFSLLVLPALFLVALSAAQARGLQVDCGCFGGDKFEVLSPTKNLWLAVARDVVLGAAAWTLYAVARRDT